MPQRPPCHLYVVWGASDELFKLRNSEFGRDYFAALAEWRRKPNRSNADHVKKELRRYSGRLLELYPACAIESLSGTLGVQKLSTRGVKNAVAFLLAIGGLVYPPFGMVIAGASGGLALWQMFDRDSAERLKQMPVAKWIDLDVVPESHTIQYLHEPVTSQGK